MKLDQAESIAVDYSVIHTAAYRQAIAKGYLRVEDCEDIAQEVVIAVLSGHSNIKKLGAYAKQATNNQVVTHVRSQSQDRTIP